MQGTYKSLNGFDYNYQINEYGDVIKIYDSNYRVKEPVRKVWKLKGGKYSNGYKFVSLTKNGQYKNYSIHRLVAETFIPNPNNYPCVNHKDGNKDNNHISNLEWCTYSQNRKHAYDTGLAIQKGTPRKVIVKFNEKIVEFETMSDCAKFFGYKKGWLHNQIRKHGLNFNYKGYEIEVSKKGDGLGIC